MNGGYPNLERPEVLALVPITAERILDVGCNTGTLGAALKQRQKCKVVGIEANPEAAEQAEAVLDQVYCIDVEQMAASLGMALPDAEDTRTDFDCIILADVLEHLHEPAKVLRWLRGLLADEGVMVISIPNARHVTVVSGLSEGGFTREAAGLLDRTHLQHFTRRELEVMLDACGFGVRAETGVRGPGYEEWDNAGRKGEIRAGRLTIGQLSEQEAEEFFIYQWLLVAHRKPQLDCGLTSIIIPVLNGLADTAACLASILKHTPEPIEIIVVDNGSTDGTRLWLEYSWPAEIKYIRNETNMGYPAACNQGAAIAEGQQLLFLNNDTLVTPGWLRRMLEALYSAEEVAAVGPRSNYVAPPQHIKQYYNSLLELDAWAWGWSLKHWHERIPAHRLVGFCLLVKRSWWEQIGGAFDEQFGIGNFEDDDLCRRLETSGGKLLVANDSFVHHEGGHTFQREGIDYNRILQENQARFIAKWQAGGAAPSSPVAAPSRPATTSATTSATHPLISVVHPTARLRPTEACPLGWIGACRQWYETCDHPEDVEYILAVHESRWQEYVRLREAGEFNPLPWPNFRVVVSHGEDCCNHNGNAGIQASTGQIVISMMDDLFAPEHWDTQLVNAVGDLEREAVVHCSSGSGLDGSIYIPQICTRARLDRLGYMGHPSYRGMFVDNEFSEHARRDGVVIEATGIVFEHRNPILHGGAQDEIYRAHNVLEEYEFGRKNFLRRQAAGFPRE